MSWLDGLRFAAYALAQHRRRSLLSLLGVAIGIIAVTSLTGLGEGARNFVSEQFGALGSRLLIVMPGRTETTGGLPGAGVAPNDLTLDDALALGRSLPEVQGVVPMSLASADVAHQERSRQVMVIGTSAEFQRARALHLLEGRFLPEGEITRGAPVVVLGRNIARELFGQQSPIGRPVRVGGWRMRVIGVLAERGTQLGLDMDETAVIPVATGLRMSNRSSLSRLVLELRPNADVEAARRRVIEILTERHDEEDITCITQEAVMSSLGKILRVLTLVVAGIASISLAVAGIGIMNVMLVSVSERKAEVGLLRALGATGRQILALFLIEAVLLSTTGGLLGLGLGWLLLEGVVFMYPALPASAPAWAVTAVLVLSLATGSLFGVLPAWRAARLDPIAALGSG